MGKTINLSDDLHILLSIHFIIVQLVKIKNPAIAITFAGFLVVLLMLMC